MTDDPLGNRAYRRQLRIFLEEVCAELCRFRHVAEDGVAPESIKIHREVAAGPDSFVDIVVAPPDKPAYAMEVKFGYPLDVMANHLAKKFGEGVDATTGIERLVILVRVSDYADRTEMETAIRGSLRADLELEIWDEPDLLRLIAEHFRVEIDTITSNELLAVRRAIDEAKWRYAFGDADSDRYLADTLLWHFGFWNLRRFHNERGLAPHEVLASGNYKGIAIVMADLCSFSSYVRDTRDEELIRHSLTAFYSCARYAIHSAGGMLYQFVGDEVVGLFGIPDNAPGYPENALDCARALVDIGESVSNSWQRELDRVQDKSGVHIGISVGELNLMPLLPFSANYIGFVGDAMNMASRLMTEAEPGGIVVSNSFYQHLSYEAEKGFDELPSVEAKNLGLIKCWKHVGDRQAAG